MAIIEKPKRESRKDATEKKIRAVISKGGTAAGDETGREKPVTFRLTEDVIRRIDKARKGRRVKTSKQSWFVEAILDKLEAEGF
jgi:hypothetical protein